MFWRSPGLAFTCFGMRCEVSHVLAIPGLRFHLFWHSRSLGFTCFGSPCEISPGLAFPWLRSRMFWFTPVLGFVCFGIPGVSVSHVSHVLAFLVRFRMFWLSPGLGFTRVGIPCEVSPVLALPGLRFHMFRVPGG